jgi:ketosteroid isomerase-like protein
MSVPRSKPINWWITMSHVARCLIVAVIAVSYSVTVLAQETDHAAAFAEIEALNQQWAQYSDAGDFASLVGLYAEDAVVVKPDGRLVGRAEIETDFRDNYREGQLSTIELDHIRVADSGELAWILGRWSSSDGYAGTFTSVLERRSNGWVFLSDAYSIERYPDQ